MSTNERSVQTYKGYSIESTSFPPSHRSNFDPKEGLGWAFQVFRTDRRKPEASIIMALFDERPHDAAIAEQLQVSGMQKVRSLIDECGDGEWAGKHRYCFEGRFDESGRLVWNEADCESSPWIESSKIGR